jgi:3-hydroxybutyrate dehydrogenase
MVNLKGKTALVTGSTSGIGLGIAYCLAKANANVILNGIETIGKINNIIQDLSSTSKGKIDYFQADLTSSDEISAMIKFSQENFGGIDILVNNAGVQYVAPTQDFPPNKWDQIISLNLTSAFHTTRLCLPHMQKNGWGRVINIASAHGLVASANKCAYVASKHGILGFTKVVALENAGKGVTCNSICPGWVLTPLVEEQIKKKSLENNQTFEQAEHDLLSDKQPSKQFAKPEEIGEYCVFLASDSAKQITGSSMTVDGGWTAQ